jgi:hypothetical protein
MKGEEVRGVDVAQQGSYKVYNIEQWQKVAEEDVGDGQVIMVAYQ